MLPHAYEENPCVVVWELTRKCSISCMYCPSSTHDDCIQDPLSLQECKQLVDELIDLGRPHLVITGGDIFEHPFFYDIVQYAINKGISISLSPAVTNRLTESQLIKVKELGVLEVAIGIEGYNGIKHDAIRGFVGAHKLAKHTLEVLDKHGFETKINTLVTKQNLFDLEAIYNEIKNFKTINEWNLWMLVPLQDKHIQNSITAKEYEMLFHWLDDLRKRAPFKIRTIAGQHFQRVILQNKLRHDEISRSNVYSGTPKNKPTLNDGNGIMYIAYNGDIYPSELLLLKAGNVKAESIKVVYRYSPIFKKLRTPNLLKGKCGLCEYRYVCGGSRARAFALTGDYLQSEPYCDYMPRAVYMRKNLEEAL